MEDALVQEKLLNIQQKGQMVLILVLMEDALVLQLIMVNKFIILVLILVLMEDALVHSSLSWTEINFNKS